MQQARLQQAPRSPRLVRQQACDEAVLSMLQNICDVVKGYASAVSGGEFALCYRRHHCGCLVLLLALSYIFLF